eukprot:g23033.t1
MNMVWRSQLSWPGLGPSVGVQGVRVHDEVDRCPQRVKCLEIGDWLEVAADLEKQTVSFTVWPQALCNSHKAEMFLEIRCAYSFQMRCKNKFWRSFDAS